ncbi:MAG: outer membrane lipoprotein-sorting protein [Oceanococcaceae bacterium]
MLLPDSTRRLALALPLLCTLALPAVAQTPEERGLEIATEADARDAGWGDSASTMTMTLRNKQGQESVREMRSRSLEVADDGDKSMIIFDEPKDVRGTALLTFSKKTGDDDQWLYLPALKRTKRIASSNKSGPFMGSEFAYEDLSSQEVEKYTYKYLRDEELNGINCFVSERFPVDTNSGYTRQVVWIDQERYIPLKVEFYDRKESLLKTLTMHDYQQYKDKHWRPDRLEMVNHQTGKSTTLAFSDYNFDQGFAERDFDSAALARIR